MSKETSPLLCPECGSHKVGEIIYGEVIVPEWRRILLGGCCIAIGSSPKWRCMDCTHDWGIYEELAAPSKNGNQNNRNALIGFNPKRYKSETADGWKSYPIRILGPGISPCCGHPKILVQSMDGGFVTANCSKCGNKCGKKSTLTFGEFKSLGIWVACPECKQKMVPAKVPGNNTKSEDNYGFKCTTCEGYIWLADLLPHYSDII
ncbi:MAG: hypothetical protein L0Y74_06240 [candidate division Zixibacteria bacterium]|nr:hypothetical protein [candidate division Zixibacteria bacterium]